EPEYSPSMGYEHPNTTSETESDEIIKSGVEERVPIPSECEVTSEDESKCDMPIQDQSSLVFKTFSNPLFKDNDDITSIDDESLFEEDIPIEESNIYSNLLFDNDEIYSDELQSHAESNFVESLSNHDALIDSSQKIDYLEEFSEELNAETTNTIVESIPSSLISIQDNDSQREEIDIVTNTDELLPPDFKNDDSDGEVDESDFDNPSFPRPPSEPPDAEFDFEPDSGEEISVVTNSIDEFECLDPRDEFDDDNYFPFMFVIRIFLPYLICSKMFLTFLSAESEDTIFDPGFTHHRLKFLVFDIIVPVYKSFTSFL
nr:hypothetical protein [Tanacetum cinerariifolium]GEZ05102.1 hypothetical protein [Tanacetum cinerariifolium]